jgi:hypothetical protein
MIGAELEANANKPATPSERKKEDREKSKEERQPGGFFKIKDWAWNDRRTQQVNRALVQYICQDGRPLTCVDQPGFSKLVSALQPSYELPGRTQFTAMIEPEYQRVHALVSELMQKEPSLTFTSDIWTDKLTAVSFISLSG